MDPLGPCSQPRDPLGPEGLPLDPLGPSRPTPTYVFAILPTSGGGGWEPHFDWEEGRVERDHDGTGDLSSWVSSWSSQWWSRAAPGRWMSGELFGVRWTRPASQSQFLQNMLNDIQKLQESDKSQIFYWSSQTCTRIRQLMGGLLTMLKCLKTALFQTFSTWHRILSALTALYNISDSRLGFLRSPLISDLLSTNTFLVPLPQNTFTANTERKYETQVQYNRLTKCETQVHYSRGTKYETQGQHIWGTKYETQVEYNTGTKYETKTDMLTTPFR